MVQHIEFTINFDLTCSALDWEDFGFDEKPQDNEYDYDIVNQ